MEELIVLPDGSRDFVDLLVAIGGGGDTGGTGGAGVACEIETTLRHVLINASRAKDLGLALWIITPDRGVADRVARKLRAAGFDLRREPICVLTLGQLSQEIRRSPSLVPLADCTGEIRKTSQGRPGRRVINT